jgi:hypothetical protein
MIFRDEHTPTLYAYNSNTNIICGWYGGCPPCSLS